MSDSMTVERSTMTTLATRLLVEHAVAEAESLGIAVTIAIYDSGAQLVAFFRMHDAQIGPADIAMDKAWTSASFGGRSTRQVEQRLAGLSEIARGALLARPRYTALAGGLPIRVGGVFVGAVGVSGGTPEQDERCAAAGFDAIGADRPAQG